jgi:hypothetical protein
MTSCNGNLPKTVKQALAKLLSDLSLQDKVKIAKMSEDNLLDLHFSVGTYIRNEFKLWSENIALVESCRAATGKDDLEPDEISHVILKELWRELRMNTLLRIVK